MSIDILVVNVAALAVVAWIVWYFWLSGSPAATAAMGEGGIQEIAIRVKDGYEPDTVRVEAGRAVRLRFNRQETAACSERVELPDFGIARALPEGEDVVIEFTADEAGEYPFTCQMGMLRGTIVATAQDGSNADA